MAFGSPSVWVVGYWIILNDVCIEYVHYIYEVETVISPIQGGPERMQHFRSIISRKQGTE